MMEEFVLYLWFGDEYLDSYSAKGIAMNRAFIYKRIPYSINYIHIPDEPYKVKLAQEAIPVMKFGENTSFRGLWTLCEFLDEYTGSKKLIPSGQIRYDIHSFTFWILESFHNSLLYYRWINEENFKTLTSLYKTVDGNIAPLEIVKKLRSDILIFNRRYSEIAQFEETKSLDFLNSQLKVISSKLENSHFLFGDQITVADIAAYSVISSLLHPSISQVRLLIKYFPHIIDWIKEFESQTDGHNSKNVLF